MIEYLGLYLGYSKTTVQGQLLLFDLLGTIKKKCWCLGKIN